MTALAPQPGTLPSSEALLRSALMASWRRDRSIGTRRKTLRWTAWLLLGRLLPLAALSLLVLLPVRMPERVASRQEAQPTVTAVPLRFARRLVLGRPAASASSIDVPSEAVPAPLYLKPDKLLHKKEP